MTEQIKNSLMTLGLQDQWLALGIQVILIVGVLFLSVIVNFITKKIILSNIRKLISKTKTKMDDILLENKIFDRLSHIAPAIVIYYSAALIFPKQDALALLTTRISIVYMVIIGATVFEAALNSVYSIYKASSSTRNLPIKSIIQVLKLIVFVLTVIFVLSILMDKSPWAFLSGIGAMTAILMLVFKDTILGFVASLQLSANDMVQPGDWIEMPQFGADGDVIEVTLNAVKVQNWDKTISTIPTYSLISDSFKNWRGMSKSGGRRIKRSILIDINTVKLCSAQLVEKFKKMDLLKDYLKEKEEEVKTYNQDNKIDMSEAVNGRRLTNLGTFRAYIKEYLKQNPKIHKDMTFLVRQLEPQTNGIPIQLYVFSNDINWINYESIQADIFDHLLAIIPEFELKVFQNPSGNDFQRITNQ